MKKIMLTAFTIALVGTAVQTHADLDHSTEDYAQQRVPATVRPRMNKAFLDSWINAKEYPSNRMSEYEKNLFVPEDFYDYE